MGNRLRTAIIIVVTGVWAANLTAPLYIRDFKPPESVNGVFMAVIGIVVMSYERDSGAGGGKKTASPRRRRRK